jgi:hypothetical protein
MENQEMNLDTYYAEQEIRLNLPHESNEQYQQRLAALKRQRFVSEYSRFNMHLTYFNSQGQHVDPFPFPATWSSGLLVGHSGNISKRKMPPTVPETTDKRQRIDDQDDSIDHPHLSSSGHRDLGMQAAMIQHAEPEFDTIKCDLNRPPSV